MRRAPQSASATYLRPAGRSWNGWKAKLCRASRFCGCGDFNQSETARAMQDGGNPMNLVELNKVANAMVVPGKGILAADESTGTIKRRFDAISVENTEDNRRDYRELLFRSADAMRNCISGAILYDETVRQTSRDGTPLV